MAKNPIEQVLEYLPVPMRNRFVLVTVLFIAWIVFFDKHDLLTQFRLFQTQRELETKRDYYHTKIEETKQDKKDLFTNDQSIEKFAREHYLMKKDNEDIFVIQEK